MNEETFNHLIDQVYASNFDLTRCVFRFALKNSQLRKANKELLEVLRGVVEVSEGRATLPHMNMQRVRDVIAKAEEN